MIKQILSIVIALIVLTPFSGNSFVVNASNAVKIKSNEDTRSGTKTLKIFCIGNGSVNPEESVEVGNEGVVIEITPYLGADVTMLKLGENDVLADLDRTTIPYKYNVSALTENTNLIVKCEYIPYKVTITHGLNGVVSPVGDFNLTITDSEDIIITPDDGYKIKSVTIDDNSALGNLVPSGNNYTYSLNGVYKPLLFHVDFEPAEYTVDYSVSGKGEVTSPTGNTVFAGADKVFNIAPADGYKIESVVNNGVDVTSGLQSTEVGLSYTILNVNTDCNVIVTFKALEYTVSVVAGDNGTIFPTEDFIVTVDSIKEVIFLPQIGYTIDKVYCNGIQLSNNDILNNGSVVKYILRNVHENMVINAEFVQEEYTITLNQPDNATVTISTDKAVTYSENNKIIITPDKGYTVLKAEMNCKDITKKLLEDNDTFIYNLNEVSENMIFSVICGVVEYKVVVTSNPGGKVVPFGINNITVADTETILIKPDDGYGLESVKLNDTEIIEQLEQTDGGYSYMLNSISEDITIAVLFKTVLTNIPVDNIGISIAPNPASETIKVAVSDDIHQSDMHIYNMHGKLLFTSQIKSHLNIDISGFKPGVYVVKLFNDTGQIVTSKFMKL